MTMSTQCLSDLADISYDSSTEKQLAAAAKALAHPARIRLLKILSGRKCLGNDLVGDLGLAQSTVSEHLRILREAGFVDAEVQHPRTCYSINQPRLNELTELLNYLTLD